MSINRERLTMDACPNGATPAVGAGMARRLLAALELVAAALFTAVLAVMALRRRRAEPMRSLQGCRVLVTEADTSFGCALVSQFMQQGCHVVRVVRPGRHESRGIESTRRFSNGGDVRPETFVCDIRDPSQLAKLALTVKERLSTIDILVCQSIVKEADDGCEGELDTIARLVSDELKTHFYMLQILVPLIEVKSGHVVTIPANTKHGTAFRSTREALVDLMTTMTDQMTQSNGITLTCARFHIDGKQNNDSAAIRLVEAIQRKLNYCDLSSSKFQDILMSSVEYVTNTFQWNVRKQIK